MGILIQFPPYTNATEVEKAQLQRFYEVMWLNGLEWSMLKKVLDHYHNQAMKRIDALKSLQT